MKTLTLLLLLSIPIVCKSQKFHIDKTRDEIISANPNCSFKFLPPENGSWSMFTTEENDIHFQYIFKEDNARNYCCIMTTTNDEIIKWLIEDYNKEFTKISELEWNYVTKGPNGTKKINIQIMHVKEWMVVFKSI